MSETPATPVSLPNANQSTERYFEHTWVHGSTNVRAALRLDQVPFVKVLKSIFGSIVVDRIEVEVAQLCDIDSSDNDSVAPGGVFFVGLIPSGKDTEAASGKNSAIVYSVPRTVVCPLSGDKQAVSVHTLPHSDFECDLALDPRKQQAIVLWSGNAGFRAVVDKKDLPLALVRWKIWVSCSGSSTIW